ncbi:hypothetical protein BY996DRAFT_6419018 [Phakopsora pachyrhizi]|nr:hypothetical protein BY996DRAFT_6419018 [Phakopsora pachyrhizi]
MGYHILSGAMIETRALYKLLPDWNDWEAPLKQIATLNSLKFLTSNLAYPLSHPPQTKNAGKNYLISLSKFMRWLGVEIYPDFSGLKMIYNQDRTGINGVIKNNSDVDQRGKPKDNFEDWDGVWIKGLTPCQGLSWISDQEYHQPFCSQEGWRLSDLQLGSQVGLKGKGSGS